jgi:hypothetical protein
MDLVLRGSLDFSGSGFFDLDDISCDGTERIEDSPLRKLETFHRPDLGQPTLRCRRSSHILLSGSVKFYASLDPTCQNLEKQ